MELLRDRSREFEDGGGRGDGRVARLAVDAPRLVAGARSELPAALGLQRRRDPRLRRRARLPRAAGRVPPIGVPAGHGRYGARLMALRIVRRAGFRRAAGSRAALRRPSGRALRSGRDLGDLAGRPARGPQLPRRRRARLRRGGAGRPPADGLSALAPRQPARARPRAVARSLFLPARVVAPRELRGMAVLHPLLAARRGARGRSRVERVRAADLHRRRAARVLVAARAGASARRGARRRPGLRASLRTGRSRARGTCSGRSR